MGLGFVMVFSLVAYNLLAVVGIIGNVVMVVATLRSKSLRSVCNILIAISCLVDAMHQLGALVFSYTIFRPQPQGHCFFYYLPPLLGAIPCSSILLSLGFDRMIAIIWPIKYKQYFNVRRNAPYLTLQLVFPVAYVVWILHSAYTTRTEIMVPCAFPTSLGPKAFEDFSFSSIMINAAIFLVYTVTWINVCKMQLAYPGPSSRAVFHSLLVTVVLVLFGWMTTSAVNIVSMIIPMSPQTAGDVQLLAGIPTFLAAAANVFVYFTLSSDYRKAIRHLFSRTRTHNVTQITRNTF